MPSLSRPTLAGLHPAARTPRELGHPNATNRWLTATETTAGWQYCDPVPMQFLLAGQTKASLLVIKAPDDPDERENRRGTIDLRVLLTPIVRWCGGLAFSQILGPAV